MSEHAAFMQAVCFDCGQRLPWGKTFWRTRTEELPVAICETCAVFDHARRHPRNPHDSKHLEEPST